MRATEGRRRDRVERERGKDTERGRERKEEGEGAAGKLNGQSCLGFRD